MNRISLLAVPALLLLVFGCSNSLAPGDANPLPEERLTFIRVAPDAPPLETLEVTFTVVAGVETVAEIRYDNAYNGGKCLLFRIPAETVITRPDGTVVTPGESIEITILVVDEARYLYEFAPAGVRFSSANPAQLEVNYAWKLQEDERTEARFGFWKQPAPGGLWSREATVRSETEARTEVTSFTRYALAAD
jgi:hypothetical protein